MTKELTAGDFRRAFERAIEIKGEDYVYREVVPGGTWACTYSEEEGGGPSCLVGWALYDLVPEFFHEVAAAERAAGSSLTVTELLNPERRHPWVHGFPMPDFSVPSKVRRALAEVQARQDAGAAWGEVLDLFELILGQPEWSSA